MTEEQRRERARDVDEVVVQFHAIEVRRGEERLRLRAIEAQSEPALEPAPGQVWPASRPLPSHYLKPQPLPCSSCRRVRMPDGAQAVVTMALRETIVYLRCKACGHRYAMPIRPAR